MTGLTLTQPASSTRVRSWVPWRPGRLVPADPDWAFGPLLCIRSALDHARPFDPREAVLAGLAVASGLGYRLDQYLTPAGTYTPAAHVAWRPACTGEGRLALTAEFLVGHGC